MSILFTPLQLRSVTIPNRVWMSPMAMYQADPTGPRAGVVTDFHFGHHAARASGGVGMIIVEATAVSPEGRDTLHDLGIWNDDQGRKLARLARTIASHDVVPGIQLGHAGRKASSERPWEGDGGVNELRGGWQPVGPSTAPFGTRNTPRELTVDEIHQIVAAYKAAAQRALAAGFRVLEIHGAHGYLIHSFLSPVSNHRTDEYGGDFAGRSRLALEVVDAVREVWPAELPLSFRVSGTDWVTETTGHEAWTIDATIRLARLLHAHGVDMIDVSSGGIAPDVAIPTDVDYQARLAGQVRAATADLDLVVASVGRITEPAEAVRRVEDGEADVLFVGRQLLREPGFARRLAEHVDRPVPTHDSYAWAI